ncbi:TRAM domain-containing protein [Candidatus Woesearchaeota archaeon]|nr:TRAM domain-containing protein [Candidatus Woesearchaeota archaeon]
MYGERSRRGGGFGGPRPPMEVGDEIDVHIEAVGEKGDGLAKVKGFVLFVPGTKEGEDCRVKVTRVLRKVGFAEKIGEAQGPVETSAPKEAPAEAPSEEEPAEEPQYEDTETFGEEPAEEPSEEAPAEEEKKE